MTIAEQLLQQGRAEGELKGRAEGRAEGRAKGLAEGLRVLLLAQLRHKFGDDVDERVVRAIEDADDAALERYSLRVLSADSVSFVLGE